MHALQRLRERLSEWVVGEPVVVRTLTEIRRGLIGDYKLRAAGWDYERERDVEVRVRESMIHGDLHGLNILVNPVHEPTLIDYGDVRRANAALDPVTLELSAVFHPALVGSHGSWPTVEQATHWGNLDQYVENSPIEGFVRECRAWAESVAGSASEVLASAYAFCARQLKYAEPTAPIAIAIAESTVATLVAGA